MVNTDWHALHRDQIARLQKIQFEQSQMMRKFTAITALQAETDKIQKQTDLIIKWVCAPLSVMALVASIVSIVTTFRQLL